MLILNGIIQHDKCEMVKVWIEIGCNKTQTWIYKCCSQFGEIPMVINLFKRWTVIINFIIEDICVKWKTYPLEVRLKSLKGYKILLVRSR